MIIDLKKKSIFERALVKTRQKIAQIAGKDEISFDDLEEILFSTDLPPDFVIDFIDYARSHFATASESISYLKGELIQRLKEVGSFKFNKNLFNIFLLTGTNGTGKTTTAAKLASYLKNQNIQVMLAAADTFRAAGSEQLEIWAERLQLPVISQQRGADPASVVFDAIESAKARGISTVIADTAGRLHTKSNLMEELKKIIRVANKAAPEDAKVSVFLAVDSNYGLNVIKQAEVFSIIGEVNYLIGTKVDSSAKAGSLLAASLQTRKPIAFLGTGEKLDDFVEFDPETFVESMFEDIR